MSSGKKYKCPYCEKRLTREQMVGHIERQHEDLLPEGFTPLRMTFHVVNKKDIRYKRPCRICQKGTNWDEKKGRYDFLCGSKQCHDAWVENMDKTMGDKKGKFRPTATAEGLEKMLAARRISNKYKWSDGTIKVYTGSYEGNALKYLDKVLDCKSEDVQCPGPVIKYMLDGKEHLYITDIYYIPYNLIIEVKDGGSNPNTNPGFAETRRKSMAKEEHIIKNTDYNYLKLTDNNLSQLLAVFADLKMHLVDNNISRVIHVNENMTGMDIAPIVGPNDIVVVNYHSNNVFADDSDYAIADSPKFDTVFVRNSIGELKKTDKNIFMECDYTPYLVKNVKDRVSNIIKENLNKFIPENFIYEAVFEHELYSTDQIIFEESATEIQDFYQEQSKINEYIKESIYKEDKMSNRDRLEENFIDEDIITEMFGKEKSKTQIFIDAANEWLKSINFGMLTFKTYGGFKYKFNSGKLNKMGFNVAYKKMTDNFKVTRKNLKEIKDDDLYKFTSNGFFDLNKLKSYVNKHTNLNIKNIKKLSKGAILIITNK